MTCNFVERIIDPLQSRCQVLKVVPPNKKQVAYHLSSIMDQEGIAFDMDDLGSIVLQFYPDLRKCINTIQANTVDKELKLDKSILTSSNYIDKVIKALAATFNSNKFKEIRQIIADANVDDFDELFKALYNRASEYLPGKEGTAAILINEHQYKGNFRIDKEINTMSLIQNLINNK